MPDIDPEETKWIGIAEASKIFCISQSTIRRMLKRGDLKQSKKIQRSRLVTGVSIEELHSKLMERRSDGQVKRQQWFTKWKEIVGASVITAIATKGTDVLYELFLVHGPTLLEKAERLIDFAPAPRILPSRRPGEKFDDLEFQEIVELGKFELSLIIVGWMDSDDTKPSFRQILSDILRPVHSHINLLPDEVRNRVKGRLATAENINISDFSDLSELVRVISRILDSLPEMVRRLRLEKQSHQP